MVPSGVPARVFFTSGVGVHNEELAAFETALRDCGIAQFNLVHVSSIFPPGCRRIATSQGLKYLSPGEIVYCVMARNATNEPGRLVSSAIGVALPAGDKQYGYLSEHHAFGQTDESAGEYAEDLAASMLASTLGIKFDPDEAWDARRQAFRMSGKIVRTSHVAQSARGDRRGRWTCVVSAAVFVFPHHLIQQTLA
ncbi:MAG: arginine decarboxylase, pyruvoyl-dependent [Candidatus Terrybacteria bacterium RIFCSPLOWO2_01_FULL_44_24]|uniref:Pyruvoyl-dependent arginine decarboxylase AaxB n=1 Tax=Candidatus Terrybacteria bacterium RIFCSPHIGHO2_01_FULL_43_35 TaxID=1802361 RepID=A0A1G2PFH5_9BACT|nr:MAG: arginine decarboxylase, pyruvoyl-dependent [Candidatus Terrybacteria bacterium RIFCSPHIGHO2_01_FULL_43_35]OHA50408.1 MAG: arginine decarboxylase, pyruvoyl-dependent [Candidatus Terrybacteria bacterium RIFCSPHIGHO2_02_FULL_43_14]OHA51697.1 MAG: arginine decarboxylase, pyruvoyl-dependent [Candidatus Terrybacteria bacterium RIFCSPLOWO2_01_FULL_44_24]